MPLLVKDIDWSETEDIIKLNVPLKGASTKNIDIFVTNLYVKVNYPPYFYEVALHDEIDDDKSKATVANGIIAFLLQKKQPGLWNQLNSSQSDDKNFLRQVRTNAETYMHEKEKERSKQRETGKTERRRIAVKEQMKLDDEERKNIKLQKQQETAEVCHNLEEWKMSSLDRKVEHTNHVNHFATTEESHNSRDVRQNEKNDSVISTESPLSEIEERKDSNMNHVKKNNSIEEQKVLAPPRNRGQIEVKFTPRILATPARESKLPEEELWLKKVAQMNKIKKEKFSDATDVEEMNPIWLKDKGNEFYKKENYVAAINAYTTALLLDSKIPMLYANRAACHLHLKQYQECIQDCTSALEFYEPAVEANALSRCRALTRRGTAYFLVGFYVDALKDYNAALKLDPQNEGLKVDAYKIRNIIQGAESSD